MRPRSHGPNTRVCVCSASLRWALVRSKCLIKEENHGSNNASGASGVCFAVLSHNSFGSFRTNRNGFPPNKFRFSWKMTHDTSTSANPWTVIIICEARVQRSCRWIEWFFRPVFPHVSGTGKLSYYYLNVFFFNCFHKMYTAIVIKL